MSRNLLLITCLIYFQVLPSYATQVSRDGRRAISEILNLKDGATVPLSIFKKYDSRTIAESIIIRLMKNENLSVPKKIKFDPMKDSEIQLYFQPKNIEAVKREGFLNLYQVKNAGRWRIENDLIRIDLGSEKEPITYKVRPKYAKMNISFAPLRGQDDPHVSRYGSISAVLDEEVKKRSTWTNSDSMIGRLYKQEVHTFYDQLQLVPEIVDNNYLEAQIWGELDVRDVKEFLVPTDIVSSDLIKLKSVGLPIHSYEEKVVNFQYQRVRKKLIYEGDEKIMQIYKDSILHSRTSIEPELFPCNKLLQVLFPIQH